MKCHCIDILQHHQILTLMIDPHHIWNDIYNARSNRGLPSNITKYCACHAKWLSWLIRVTHETLFTMRGATEVTLQHHQKLRLPRKMTLMIDPRHRWKVIYNARSNRGYPPTSPNTAPATQNNSPKFRRNVSKTAATSFTMRDRSSDPTMIRPRLATEVTFRARQEHLIFYWNIQHFARRLSFQISRNAAPATKSDTWTSPNTVPATQNDSPKLRRNFSKTAETSFTMRDGSEHDPRMKPSLRNPPRNGGYFSRSPRAISIEKCNIISRYHSKFHAMLHLPRQVTLELIYCACHAKWLSWMILVTYETLFTMRGATEMSLQHHEILRLPRQITLMIDPRHIWNVIYNARSNRGYPPTSPNTAPATQNDSHDWSASHMKQRLPSNITKYCDCHAKWLSWLIRVTYETLFTCAEQQRLPSNITKYYACHAKWLSKISEISRKQVKRHLQCGTDPSRIRPWSENETVSPQPASQPRLLFVLTTSISTTSFRAPAIIPNFTQCCTCHEKWHLNFTKYCACHEKWHLNDGLVLGKFIEVPPSPPGFFFGDNFSMMGLGGGSTDDTWINFPHQWIYNTACCMFGSGFWIPHLAPWKPKWPNFGSRTWS